MSWWSEVFFRLPQPWSFPSRRPGNHPPHSGLWWTGLKEGHENPSYLVRSWGKGPTQPPIIISPQRLSVSAVLHMFCSHTRGADGHCPGKKLVVFGRLQSACFSCWRSHHQISTPAAGISLNRPRLSVRCIPRSENQHGQEGRYLLSKKKNVRMMVWFRWCPSSSRPVFSGSMLIFQGVLKL